MNFILFTDIDNDKIYKNQNVNVCVMGGIGNLECIQKYSMRNGTHIDSICAGKDDSTCDNNITALSIIFTRPSLAANIYIDNEPQQIPDNRKNYAKITLAASSGATTSVVALTEDQHGSDSLCCSQERCLRCKEDGRERKPPPSNDDHLTYFTM